jgi:hypothetical protein
MNRIGKLLLAMVCVASLVSACGTPASLTHSGTLNITSKVYGSYQDYLSRQGGVRKEGTFLVVMNGDIGVSARWSYCPTSADYCTTSGLNVANDMCVQEHLKCVLFARGPTIVVPYKIID